MQKMYNPQKTLYLQKETKSAEASFFYRYAEVQHTFDVYHYHKEFELVFHIENSGTRYVGDSIKPFKSGDLVLVGPNIPHYWHSDEKYYTENSPIAKLVVIHFMPDFLGHDFLNAPEMAAIRTLFDRAGQGIRICGSASRKIGSEIVALTQNKEGWRRIVDLITILNEMGEAENYELLASVGFCNMYGKSQKKMKATQIFNYIVENFDRDISLSDAAMFTNMSVPSFCRYFKGATNKTFSELLNEVRIGRACRYLINSDMSLSEIGYCCGYQNVTYFNRQFKKITGMTPSEYKTTYKNVKDKIVAENTLSGFGTTITMK